ncbi:putative acetyltransferase EpsM [Virgisporangium aliadipatigenens]|uniref:Putative acetyltransferase EpsM n=1 Tax=Virgisporangium aliadipatigenens TaxID=741659 RepID=A0A8J3YHZ3_9ACTN|nr:acetyltransferase [Virgisporangium aliadipatigenens]GIJ44553.1 putative acetyltransferase EpsM [Virgisporangium aliadipatigenens]
MKPLLIAGAGGLARETAAVVAAVNRVRPTWDLLGFLDDEPALHGTSRGGVPIVGPLAHAQEATAGVVVCIGNPNDPGVRKRVVARLGLPAERYATLVHPSAEVGSGCLIGPGTVLLAHTVLTADVTVGAHVAVMPHVVLTHDDVVEDFVTIAAGVRLGGNVRIGPAAYLGSGALVRQGVRIGEGALIGMGSVVLHDVPPGEVWVGNPARRLRSTVTKETQPHGSTAR